MMSVNTKRYTMDITNKEHKR
nr:hypothetical protein [Candidatus Anoxychlamydiales bacterium]